MKYLMISGFSVLLLSCTNVRKEGKYTSEIEIFNNTEIDDVLQAIEAQDSSEIYNFFKTKKSLIDFQEPKFGYSLLMWSVQNDKYNSTRFLLELDANPNLFSKDNSTALIIATYREDITFLKLLISYNADLSVKRKNTAPKNIIDAAIRSLNDDEFEKVKYIIEDLNYNKIVPLSNCSNNVVNISALFGQFEIVEYLIKNGANINCPVPNNDTSLHRTVLDLVIEMEVDNRFSERKDTLIEYLKQYQINNDYPINLK